MNDKFTIEQLSERAEVSRRTIRYCIQKGLIKPPIRRGRWSFYDYDTLEKLREIGRLRTEGKSFTKIKESLRSQIPEEWIIYRLQAGFEIHFNSSLHKRWQERGIIEEILRINRISSNLIQKNSVT